MVHGGERSVHRRPSRSTSRWSPSSVSCSATTSTSRWPSISTLGSRAGRRRCRIRPKCPSASAARASGGRDGERSVDDLAAEQRALQECVAIPRTRRVAARRRRRAAGTCATRSPISPTSTRWRWTPWGGGAAPRQYGRSTRAASPDDVTFLGVVRGRRRCGADVLAWWERPRPRRRDLLSTLARTGRGSNGASGCARAHS